MLGFALMGTKGGSGKRALRGMKLWAMQRCWLLKNSFVGSGFKPFSDQVFGLKLQWKL